MFTSCIVSWDCGVEAIEDDVVKIPSSSRDRKWRDTKKKKREREREPVSKYKPDSTSAST